jgi:hypothetical protein
LQKYTQQRLLGGNSLPEEMEASSRAGLGA